MRTKTNAELVEQAVTARRLLLAGEVNRDTQTSLAFVWARATDELRARGASHLLDE